MKTLHVNTGSYDIVIGSSLSETIVKDIEGNRVLIVTDSTTEKLFGNKLLKDLQKAGRQTSLVSFPAGEKSKTLRTYEKILKEALDKGLDRSSCIVALGGGVVGDIAGFAAATYMRGIKIVQIPTTLLAQVDSSVGGKTGVNLSSTKNIVGAYHQPARVYCDSDYLKNLPEGEFLSGLGEVLKYGCILDSEFFNFMEQNTKEILAREPKSLLHLIKRSCELKAQVVDQDEKESGLRRILNFGHTIGHGVEVMSDLKHGECVALGMAKEAILAEKLGSLSHEDTKRIIRLIKKYGFETDLPKGISVGEIIKKTASDKKTVSGAVHYVILEKIGKVKEIIPIEEKTIREVLS